MPAPKGDKRTKAIAALLTSYTYTEAAQSLNVCKETISKWMADPGFVADLKAAADATLSHAIHGMKGLVGAAMATLARDLSHESSTVRQGAADKILTHAAKFLDLMDQADEFREMRARFDALQAGTQPRHVGDARPDGGETTHALPGPATDAVPLP